MHACLVHIPVGQGISMRQSTASDLACEPSLLSKTRHGAVAGLSFSTLRYRWKVSRHSAASVKNHR